MSSIIVAILFSPAIHKKAPIAEDNINRITDWEKSVETSPNIIQENVAITNKIMKSTLVKTSLLSLAIFSCDVACAIAQKTITAQTVMISTLLGVISIF